MYSNNMNRDLHGVVDFFSGNLAGIKGKAVFEISISRERIVAKLHVLFYV